MKHSDTCTLLTAQFEGLRTAAYQDGNGKWTIGYGHTHNVKAGDTCTEPQARAWLAEDLDWTDVVLSKMVKVPLEQNEWDALCDFVFNIGSGNFETSTCLAKLNVGDKGGAIESICYLGSDDKYHGWVIVAGEVSSWQVRRRQAEQALFRTLETV
jgi:lysozyme